MARRGTPPGSCGALSDCRTVPPPTLRPAVPRMGTRTGRRGMLAPVVTAAHDHADGADIRTLLDPAALAAATPRSLLATYASILAELRQREVVRTNDAPVGQYAEWLALEVLGGVLAPNSEKSYDLVDAAGRTIQVKARVLNKGTPGERQLSAFRSFDFDVALVLLFDGSYGIAHAVELTSDQVRSLSTFHNYVNAYRLIVTDKVLAHGVDVAPRFRAAAGA